MLRFDSESELESHALGRSLLSMIRDDCIDFDTLRTRMPVVAQPNPFDALRHRLATTTLAIRELHAQVHLVLAFPPYTCASEYMCFDFEGASGLVCYAVHTLGLQLL